MEWWKQLSDFWRGAAIVTAAFLAGGVATTFLYQQVDLPARVTLLEDRSFQHDTAIEIRRPVIEKLIQIANDNATAIVGLSGLVARIVCVQEADAGIRSIRECALINGRQP